MAYDLANEGLDPDERRAADYVLGTLRGPGRAKYEAALKEDEGLARLVTEWEERLVLLHDGIDPVEPRPETWQRITRRLGREQKAEMGVPPRVVRSRFVRARTLWQSLALWRGLALLGLLVALYAAFGTPLPPPVLVGVLGAGEDPAFALRIAADGRGGAVTPVRVADPPPGSAYELWAVDAQGKPLSLGLLSPHAAMPLPPEPLSNGAARDGTALQVSLEPVEGSPSGRPTGKVVFEGRLIEVR